MLFESRTILASLALAGVGSTLSIRDTQTTYSAACPYNYPVELNTTESHNGLIFSIASNNPITKNRAVQLRTVGNTQVAAIDATSPVLLGQLKQGALYSENRSETNQLYDLGPTASLKLFDRTGNATINSTRYAFEFGSKKTVDKQFYLQAPSEDGTYGLYHQEPVGSANGFMLCSMDKGTWYQLFYNDYYQYPPERPECEYIGVRSTVGATIYNGQCDIGGYHA